MDIYNFETEDVGVRFTVKIGSDSIRTKDPIASVKQSPLYENCTKFSYSFGTGLELEVALPSTWTLEYVYHEAIKLRNALDGRTAEKLLEKAVEAESRPRHRAQGLHYRALAALVQQEAEPSA